MGTSNKTGLLSSYRVLDLSDEKGTICGLILAQLGAEVIKVEFPTGGNERKKGPFAKGVEAPENSLFWSAFNRGKKGITLDLKSISGKDILKKLVQNADIVWNHSLPGTYKTSD